MILSMWREAIRDRNVYRLSDDYQDRAVEIEVTDEELANLPYAAYLGIAHSICERLCTQWRETFLTVVQYEIDKDGATFEETNIIEGEIIKERLAIESG